MTLRCLWVLFAAPFVMRRWLRIKRGQCASCGYSLCGSPHSEKGPNVERLRETPRKEVLLMFIIAGAIINVAVWNLMRPYVAKPYGP